VAADGARVNIQAIDLNELRRNVGLVTQNVQLFQATVRDNLTFFSRDIPDDQIIEVLERLGLSEWHASLPDGLDSALASEGSNLSAGQAQLLALARIFLLDPGLVILDEASSRLDPATEQLIDHAIEHLFENRTAIVIAHRLSTVRKADKIMIMENGRIEEIGARDALAHDPTSRFFQLLQTGLEEVLA
jgi:ABC-type multidrug transport system fused ATPase/permease subunit